MRARWLFFTLFAAKAMPGRFMSIFYLAHNQTPTQIGILMATPPLVSLLATPLLCNLADRTSRHELVAAMCQLAAMLSFLAQLVALPSFNLLAAPARFPVLLALRIVFGCFSSAVYPLVSALAIAQLRAAWGEKGHERFGAERLWGAVSWAVVALVLGVVLDLPRVQIWVVHVGLLLFGTGFLVALWKFESDRRRAWLGGEGEDDVEARSLLPVDYDAQVEEAPDGAENDANAENRDSEGPAVEDEDAVSMSPLTAMYRILTEGGSATPMFFNLIFWLSAGMSLVENLLFLFFENDLHASNFLCGLSVVVTVVFEIPLFARAPQLLARYGAPPLAIAGALAFVVRGFGYAVAPNGWVALLLEPLHGVTYGSAATASVSYVADRTPRELEATGQSFLTVIRALGSTMGTMLGGYVMQEFGSKVLYRTAGLLVLTATIAFAIVDRFAGKRPWLHVVIDTSESTATADEADALSK